jgi:hypothetical protein
MGNRWFSSVLAVALGVSAGLFLFKMWENRRTGTLASTTTAAPDSIESMLTKEGF